MNYNELQIAADDKREETKILDQLYECINHRESFLYDTGAGAGKTFALKEALFYILKKFGKCYECYGQKILCITYTNVAVKEIKARLGNTNLVLISTIHERIWDIIKRFQKELISLHRKKLEEINKEIEDFINTDEKAKWYNEIDDKDNFYQKVKEHLLEYNRYYNKRANEFKESFTTKFFEELKITNVSNFKDTVNKILEREKNGQALEKLNSKQIKEIKYNSQINNDKLYKFQISHDTLLEYAEKLIMEFPTLQNLLADKFPIIFVDEYQDTSERVINFINLIKDKSIVLKKPICIGLFGDSKQNIYDDGIGTKIYDLINGYKIITNNYNRRSCQEVIKIANRIRNDDIEQKSIYYNFTTNDCKLLNEKMTDEKVEELKQKWNISKENKLHCFLLKNENVAEKNSFSTVYQAFKRCYPGSKYEQLNSELFSNDEFKLGEIELMFKNVLRFKNNLTHGETLVADIIDIKNKDYNIEEIRKKLLKCKKIAGNTLLEYITSFFNELKEEKEIIKYILGDDIDNFDKFKNKIISIFFKNEDDPDIMPLLDLPMDELENWYKYVTNNFEDNDVVFQTLHSTKGLQYDNVIIYLDDNFARDSKYFKRFFENYNKEIGDEKELVKYNKAQNLLYVGITRAIKNLVIFYEFDIENETLSNNINEIFNL